MAPAPLPGTAEHQRYLAAIAAHYAHDARVDAVCVFGSLGRGTWDAYSDLDLDVVLADGVRVDPSEEVRRLCDALGEAPVSVELDGPEAADVVLPSLMELSIRYHPLATTSPNILYGLRVLVGRLDAGTIMAAGIQNRRPPADPASSVRASVRLAVTLDGRLHRRLFWLGYQTLYLARQHLFQAAAAARGRTRPYHAAEEIALPRSIRDTLPGDDLPSLQRAFLALLDALEHDLPALTQGQAALSPAQRDVVVRLRERQRALDLGVR
jgi:predicted nucleotidyltransferase